MMESTIQLIVNVLQIITFIGILVFLIIRANGIRIRRRRRRENHLEEMRDVFESILITLRNKFDNNKNSNDA